MKDVILKRVVAISLLVGAACCHAAGQYEDRWFYVSRNLTKQEHVREIANIVKTAKAADLNGMLFACGVERWNNWPADRRARLTEVKRICDAAGIEIIPIVWSVGYGGHDPAYAAALPCTGMKFTVKGGKAVFAGGGAGDFANPGFDEPTEKPNRATGWEWTDKPGAVSFIDTDVKASGTASLRMEKYGANDHGHGRACHLLKVGDAGRYKVSCKIKTEGVDPTSGLMMQVYAMDGRRVSAQRPNFRAAPEPPRDTGLDDSGVHVRLGWRRGVSRIRRHLGRQGGPLLDRRLQGRGHGMRAAASARRAAVHSARREDGRRAARGSRL